MEELAPSVEAKLLKKSSYPTFSGCFFEVGVFIYIYLIENSVDFLEEDLSECSEGFLVNLFVLSSLIGAHFLGVTSF